MAVEFGRSRSPHPQKPASPSLWTTGRSSTRRRWTAGRGCTESDWISFDRESQSRMPSSRASTGGSETNVSTQRSFGIWMPPGLDYLSGSVTTTRSDRTAPSGAFRRGNSRKNGTQKHRAGPDSSTRSWPSYRGRVTEAETLSPDGPSIGISSPRARRARTNRTHLAWKTACRNAWGCRT